MITLLALVLILAITSIITHKPLPDNSQRTTTLHLPPNPESLIARQLMQETQIHQGESGIYPLANSRDAFIARLALVELAEKSLDVQYYIWHNDISGQLLAQSLKKAAARGVRVRLLLDDHTMAGMDDFIADLNAQNNLEVRLFNPYMQRRFRPLGYLSDFFRLNRRMHNKSLTADSVVSIIGGRNIGDEYFQATSGVMFADLDVAAVGEAAEHTAQQFDRYWNSESAYPAENILKTSTKPLETNLITHPDAKGYLQLLAQSSFAQQLREGNLPLIWARTQLVSDPPEKVLGKSQTSENLYHAHIAPLLRQTQQHLLIVSPYFVPTKQGATLLSELASADKYVAVLTNSLAANDVAIVHSGYAKYRKPLLKSGVALYELKTSATIKPSKMRSIYDGSGASLHAKTFTLDDRYLYIGSFNLDPRSANFNTEMGLIIESPQLAKHLKDVLTQGVKKNAYQVVLTETQNLQWQTQTADNTTEQLDQEPASSFIRRAQVWIASKLPIEWLL